MGSKDLVQIEHVCSKNPPCKNRYKDKDVFDDKGASISGRARGKAHSLGDALFTVDHEQAQREIETMWKPNIALHACTSPTVLVQVCGQAPPWHLFGSRRGSCIWGGTVTRKRRSAAIEDDQGFNSVTPRGGIGTQESWSLIPIGVVLLATMLFQFDSPRPSKPICRPVQ